MTRSAQNAQRPTKRKPAQPINTMPLPSYIPSTAEELAYERARLIARAIAANAEYAKRYGQK